MVLVFNQDGLLIKINEAARRVVGASMLGATPAERRERGTLRDTEGRPLEIEDFPSTHALRGETVDRDFTYATGPEELMQLHGRATPLRRADGTIRGAVLVLYPKIASA